MFQGSLPQDAMKVIGNIVKDWNCERIFIGCSGNFTIERSISSFENVKNITSNDVTIYSSWLGKYFAGESLEELKIRDDYDGKCNFFKEYMFDDTAKICTLIMATDVVKYEEKDIPFYVRMLKAYEEQWPELHKKMYDKLSNVKLKVDSFYFGDVMDMLDDIEEHEGFISFPPFFKGGYEKMWKGIERIFTYESPEYEEFDPDVHIKRFCQKVSEKDNFVIGTERKVDELEEYYSGVVLTAKGKPIYFYSKTDRKVFVKPKMKRSVLKLERIKPDEEVEEVKIKKLSHEQFDELRAVYLSKMINPARETAAYGLFSKGKLFGVFAFSSSMTLVNSFGEMITQPSIYLMTDFAVSPTKEKHLSKLVVMCVLSHEAKQLAEGLMNKRVRSVVTNAFSRNPVSMKYRGVFEQLARKEMEKFDNGKVKKYNLTYGAEMGKWSLEEAFEKWKRK